MNRQKTALSNQHDGCAESTDEMLGDHFDNLASRQYLKDDQSSHRRFQHLYEDLLM
jgi:hypothetical protein